MENASVQAVVLAAGSSSRFKTSRTKLCFSVCGQELIAYPVKLLAALHIPVTCVVGFQKELVIEALTRHRISNLSFVEQIEPRGTGHALACASSHFSAEHILVMNGDMPLLTAEIIESLVTEHLRADAAASFVISQSADPSADSYGRIVRQDGTFQIIEAREYDGNRDNHPFVNAGIYLFKTSFLNQFLKLIEPSSRTGEFYLTELIRLASSHGEKIVTSVAPFDSVRGINTLRELWAAEHIKRSDLITHWMDQGVRFVTAQNIYLDCTTIIGPDTVIAPGCILVQGTTIGSGCYLGAYSYLSNSIVHDNAIIHPHSVITDSTILSGAQIGPFAQIKSSSVGEQATVGNFVEMNRSKIGTASKAKHLSYVGDALIGDEVNVGAGTITCNYDGVNKHKCFIGNQSFIGCNTALVAPVNIGEGAITGAGSVITDDVPANALAIGRSRQVTKEDYAPQLRARLLKEKGGAAPTTSAS